MAASQMIDKNEDNLNTQARTNGMTKNALSTDIPRHSLSTNRFQNITKQIISTTRKSSTGADRSAPNLLSTSKARSSSTGKYRRNSLADAVIACTAGDVNRRYSHHTASSSMANHGGSHHTSSNSKLDRGSSHPSLSSNYGLSHSTSTSNKSKHGSSHPISSSNNVTRGFSHHTSSSNHGSSRPTLSSIELSHTFSHPTSSSSKLTRNGSTTLQGNDTDLDNSHCVSDQKHPLQGPSRADAGVEQMHSQLGGAEPSFSHHKSSNTSMTPSTNAGSPSSSNLQGKSASRKLANTSSETRESRAAVPKGILSVTDRHTKSQAETRDRATKHKPNDFCKDCKASIMESVCFIANNGRVSAASTGGAYARHFHHCSVPGCASNQSHQYQFSLALSKKASLSKRQVRVNPQPTRTKSHPLPGIGDRRSVCSSSASSIQGDIWSTYDGKQELNHKEVFHKSLAMKADVNADSYRDVFIDQIGLDRLSPSRDPPRSCSMQVAEDQQSHEENGHGETAESQSTLAASWISSDIHDDDEKVSVNMEFNDVKSLSYHGDNEYSCSEDGSEVTRTPNSSIKGAFDDLSNIDIEQSGCENKALQPRRSTVVRMRQKYLESLREQEAEKVRLRKQEIMARKQAEDWMLDCHMEEVLHRLAPNGEARVKVLVKAYETVIHHSDSEGSHTHHQDHNLHEQEHLENLHRYASS